MKSKAINGGVERVFVFILDQGEEAFESITEFANRENITGGSVSAIGAFSEAKVVWFDFAAKTFKPIEVNEQCEVLSLLGDVAQGDDGKASLHLHAVLGLQDGMLRPPSVWIGAANAGGDDHGNRGSSAPHEAVGSQHLVIGGNMYALFEGKRQIGNPFATEKEVREAALIEELVTDVPVADEEGDQLLPAGYHVKQVDEGAHPRGVKRRS